MDTSKSSGLKLYSLGIVTKAKTRGDDFIEVTPIEDFSMDKGGLSPDSKEYKVSTPDQHGVSKPSSIKGGSVIKAKWVPFGHSNRETSPDVQPSETVILFSHLLKSSPLSVLMKFSIDVIFLLKVVFSNLAK